MQRAMERPKSVIAVMAHNEERRIARCLASLPLGDPWMEVHAVVNGSRDRTAAIARGFAGVTVHEYEQGGKARSWNRFVFDTPEILGGIEADFYIFVDGDAEVLPGSLTALVQVLEDNPGANAAAGLPLTGRNAVAYRSEMVANRGLFGALYALRGDFVRRMRRGGIRLPDDVVGDDGLLGAMAKTDLANEDDWDDERVVPCFEAGFLCEPVDLFSPVTLIGQYKRMVNYSVRHFQNRMITAIMRAEGPKGLPPRLAALYPAWLPTLSPRRHPQWWWFDRQALARMARAAASAA